MKSALANLAVGLSFFLGVAVCVLAVRGRNGADRASWTYFRYLPDRSVRSNEVHLGSDHQHVWLSIGWGAVGPFNGQLVWGYHMNADNSGGRPQLAFWQERCDGFTRWVMDNSKDTRWASPLSWESASRKKEADGDDSYSLRISMSHWLLAVLLFVAPLWKLNRIRKAHCASKVAPSVAPGT
jgi:hypothetical protein